MKRKILSLLLILALTLALAACGENATVLRVALGDREQSLDPAYTENGSNATAVLHLYDNLLRVADDGNGGTKLASAAALSYEIVENYDGTVSYRFTMDPNATWSDGEPVTAENFVYAWRRLLDPTLASPHAELLSVIKGYDEAVENGDASLLEVKAEEDGKLSVTLAWHCPYFLRSVCAAAPTMPVRRDVVEQYGRDWGSKHDAIVCNGFYTVDAWGVDGLTLAKRENAPEDAPDTIQFLPAATVPVAEQLLADGKADFISPIGEESFLRVSGTPDYIPVPLASTLSVCFGSRGACTDSFVRAALCGAVDYAAIAEIFQGKPVGIAGGLVPDGILCSDGREFRSVNGVKTDAKNENYDFRCESAREALSSAETTPDAITLVFPTENADFTRVADTLASVWHRELGVSVRTEALSDEEMQRALRDGDFDAALVKTESEVADAMSFLSWYGGTDSEEQPRISESYSTLLRIAMGALDEQARDSYLLAAENELLAASAALPVAVFGTSYEKSSAVHNVAFDGVGNWLFHGVSMG